MYNCMLNYLMTINVLYVVELTYFFATVNSVMKSDDIFFQTKHVMMWAINFLVLFNVVYV